MKKTFLIALFFVALTALVTFYIGPKGGLPEPFASKFGQFTSRTFYALFLAIGIGYSVLSPLEPNEPRWSRLLFVLGVVISCLVVEAVLDYFIWQPRPGWKNMVVGKSSGFPSGHALGSFAMASVLSSLPPRWAAISFFSAFLVAYSRVEVQAHYPHQVVAGAILGVLIGGLIMGFREKWLQNQQNNANYLARSQAA